LDDELVISSGSDYKPGFEEEEDSEEDVSLVIDLAANLDMGGGVASSDDEEADVAGESSSKNCEKRKREVPVTVDIDIGDVR